MSRLAIRRCACLLAAPQTLDVARDSTNQLTVHLPR